MHLMVPLLGFILRGLFFVFEVTPSQGGAQQVQHQTQGQYAVKDECGDGPEDAAIGCDGFNHRHQRDHKHPSDGNDVHLESQSLSSIISRAWHRKLAWRCCPLRTASLFKWRWPCPPHGFTESGGLTLMAEIRGCRPAIEVGSTELPPWRSPSIRTAELRQDFLSRGHTLLDRGMKACSAGTTAGRSSAINPWHRAWPPPRRRVDQCGCSTHSCRHGSPQFHLL